MGLYDTMINKNTIHHFAIHSIKDKNIKYRDKNSNICKKNTVRLKKVRAHSRQLPTLTHHIQMQKC